MIYTIIYNFSENVDPLSQVILLSLLPGPKLKFVHIFLVFVVHSTGGFAILA